jgi:hypothetical protein
MSVAPRTAMALISSLLKPNTMRRCAGIGAVVHVYNRAPRTAQAFKGAANQFLARLHQDLNRDIVRNAVFVNQAADEVELDLRSGRETDFDFLEADCTSKSNISNFSSTLIGIAKRLIAVAQIDAAPDRAPM